MDDFRADAQGFGLCAQISAAFLPNTYRCASVEDYVLNHRDIRPTTPVWFSRDRKRFADFAIVLFPKVTRFNYDPESNDQRLDLSDLSGSTDLLVAPLFDNLGQPVGLSPGNCASLMVRKQVTFAHATCLWHPEWPCLALASYTPYRASDHQDRFRGTGFDLPDEIGFA